jgi:histidine triad (HIT) family protein
VSDCEFCAIVRGQFESEELYSDDKVVAVLHLKPAAPGQILLFTREHYSIMEQVPDFVMSHVLNVVNKLSIAMFETINAQGTNIIIENGVAAGQGIPHFAVSIVPRYENDGLRLEWQPKKVSEEEMDVVLAQIKEECESVHPSAFEREKAQVVSAPVEDKTVGESDYRAKQLRRIP